ncbi:hypothetical protein JCM6882_005121 [Rhodosporidiobolus microsporus]
MSIVDFRPRTVSSQLRGAAGLDDSTGSSPALAWNDWGATGYSPDRPSTAAQPYLDPYADLIAENAFGDFPSQRPPPSQFQPELGFEMHMAMGGIAEEPAGGERGPADEVTHPGDETINSHAFPLAGPSHAQSYPASTCSSPARSRASSLQSIAPPNLQMSALTSPASPFFPGGLPSPFHDHPSAFSSTTINPAHSVRSSSPSDTSSVSGLNMSRIESGSATSSVYGGNGGGGETSTAPSTPYRSNSISSRGTGSERQSHQKHLRRRSSPIKGARHARKLSNADRKAICQFHLAHPGLKQDDIGAHFGFERSTISKTLKYKERYLAMDSDDESSATAIIRSAEQDRRNLSSSTEQGTGLVPSSSVSSLHSLDSHASADLSSIFAASTSTRPPPPPTEITGGRFPQIDNALARWAREQVPRGQPLTDAAMQRQARHIARELGSDNFKASQTWLDGFKQRAGIANGVFRDMLPPPSPAAPAPTPKPTSQAFLPPPKEEENEDDDVVVAHDEDADEDYDLPGTRRSKRRLGGKTVRRLTSAKSALASFADGMLHRSSTPQRTAHAHSSAAMDVEVASPFNGGSFGDLSMDADATPTHTTVHSRTSTAATERPNGLAGPFTYSPTGVSETGSIVTSTPSRNGHHAPSPLMLGGGGSGSGEYSPPESLSQYGYPSNNGGLSASYSSQDLASSQSSLANFDGGGAFASSGFDSVTASPAPTYAHQHSHQQQQYHPQQHQGQQHGRSGSTASTNSVYSGLTAFSTSHSQGPGTPLTGSLYGSFRDSQSNLCSVPGTPATASSLGGCFGGGMEQQQQQQQQQLQAAFPGASSSSSAAASQYTQPSSASSSQHLTQHSSHQRYPHHSNGYPGTPNHPHPLPSSATDQPGSAGRRATISGGAPFAGRSSGSSTAMAPSLSLSQLQLASSTSSSSAAMASSRSSSGVPVSLEQAFSSLEIALGFLSTSAGQDYVSPKDLIVLADLRGKMERARNAQGVNLAAISHHNYSSGPGSAPATPSSLGPSPFSQQSPFAPQQQSHYSQHQQAPIAAFASAGGVSPHKAQRLKLGRTQSTSSVPSFGAMGSAGALERGMLTRRSGSSLSLYEVEGH